MHRKYRLVIPFSVSRWPDRVVLSGADVHEIARRGAAICRRLRFKHGRRLLFGEPTATYREEAA